MSFHSQPSLHDVCTLSTLYYVARWWFYIPVHCFMKVAWCITMLFSFSPTQQTHTHTNRVDSKQWRLGVLVQHDKFYEVKDCLKWVVQCHWPLCQWRIVSSEGSCKCRLYSPELGITHPLQPDDGIYVSHVYNVTNSGVYTAHCANNSAPSFSFLSTTCTHTQASKTTSPSKSLLWTKTAMEVK